MDCMKAIGVPFGIMEQSFLENLERKVMDFDKELKKIWLALDDRVKRTDALEKQREELRDSVAYLKSQSMRNNLGLN
ncbi:hypothetical protein DPMN_068818 [Dreissena polymorpha]|uniref:Uncharacterized protein n=1 Tax=Dreissena polymorpha TaxID=45954 RepID=A0A9D3Z2B0_DREPO|nr:hypothetical protein DPMN_068818 [Dreissena polymorpha]